MSAPPASLAHATTEAPLSSLTQEVTTTLLEIGEVPAGDGQEREMFDRLVPLVYDELRRMARNQIRKGGGLHTLDTTGLVNEAYVRLVQAPQLPLRSRSYFFGAATQAMRNVLVDAARRRSRSKRGGRDQPVTLDEAEAKADTAATEILELNDLIDRLAQQHERPAKVLESRVFGGLTVHETADLLDLSHRTVNRDEAFARAWLKREIGAGDHSGRAD